jgi:hypothetical protein
MCASIYTFAFISTFIIGRAMGQSEPTDAPLNFYIVSEQKVDAGRFIDTTNFPKLGFITAEPDLIITNLADVYPTKEADFRVDVDEKGKQTIVPTHPAPSVSVQLRAKDVEKLKALTEKAVNKKLLVMLGDKPLIAPKILYRIEGGCFSVTCRNASEEEKLENEFKKLVR